jgi:hypothetical protein
LGKKLYRRSFVRNRENWFKAKQNQQKVAMTGKACALRIGLPEIATFKA